MLMQSKTTSLFSDAMKYEDIRCLAAQDGVAPADWVRQRKADGRLIESRVRGESGLRTAEYRLIAKTMDLPL